MLPFTNVVVHDFAKTVYAIIVAINEISQLSMISLFICCSLINVISLSMGCFLCLFR